jgi:hypothetical protein
MKIYVGKLISRLQMDIELKQEYIEALVPSFHKPLKTSSIKFFGLLSQTGSDFPGPVSPGRFH